ncbi:elongation factor Ts, mitochondrial-like [Diadema antillarum]|uniref:elongation factor Ts, mitochondrial-like n=1 Tax=Diadema antillarum TaxID=105358 RepID=UPI003A88042C
MITPLLKLRGLSLCVAVRHLHTSSLLKLVAATAVSSSKANLAKLRKKTGFSFVNCRKALEKFDNDVEKAEVWLREQAQKEGWSKATKLQGRVTAQGLIGVLCQDNAAVMVEVNCETDFVARNSKFQHLVSHVAATTLASQREKSSNQEIVKISLGRDDLKTLVDENSKTVEDSTALTIGQVGENMSVRRALFLSSPQDSFIGSYVHSALQKPQQEKSSKCTMGKYGALVVFTKLGETSANFRPEVLGRRLSQHVVGMNPLRIGVYTPPDPEVQTKEEQTQPPSESSEETSPPPPAAETESDEMLNQEYLLDPSLTVGELLQQENIQVLDFVRFECGESAGDS